MTEYMPTTEEIREHWRSAWRPSTPQASDASFDRWLAAHDAEVRAGMLPKGAEFFPDMGGIQSRGEIYYPADYVITRTDIAKLRAQIEAEVRASVLAEQGEPEWEWGYRLVGDDGDVYKIGFAYDDPREPSERGRMRVVEENEVHEANGMPRLSFELIRRRKAGPWLPVEEDPAS